MRQSASRQIPPNRVSGLKTKEAELKPRPRMGASAGSVLWCPLAGVVWSGSGSAPSAYALTSATAFRLGLFLSQDVDRSHHLGDGIAITVPLTGERIDV